MKRGPSIRRLAIFSALALLVARRVPAVTEPPPDPVRLGLYEWMGVAATVVAADVVVDDGRFVRAVVRTPIKGPLGLGAIVEIDQRRANRDREEGSPALDLTKGKAYVLLLTPSTAGKKEPYPVFDLARGARGAKLLPAEGSDAVVDAATRLGAIQERKNDDDLWSALPRFLDDTNPFLVDAALDLYLKFRRESEAIAEIVAPLLEHPRPDFRLRAAVILGRILTRPGAEAIPERAAFVAELTGRARRDEDASVRRAAAVALASLPEASIEEILRAIARDDPDQDVRFEAVKALSERARPERGKRSD